MTEFLTDYGLFMAKSLTVFILVVVGMAIIIGLSQKGKKGAQKGDVKVTELNEAFDDVEVSMLSAVLSEKELKAHTKAEEKAKKQNEKKAKNAERKKRVFVLDFDGDVEASQVEYLREEVTAVLMLATEKDEVVLKLESPGGMVHGYGLAASQIARIRKQNVPLTIAVDAVAASGGYMMACLGNKIIAAPFAIIGSIGVVAQVPNFHRLLKKNDVDYELFTAGEYKRTVTVFGENTEQGKQKFKEDLEDTHVLFKDFVSTNRPQVDIEKVATGEVWYGAKAVDCNLVDEILTSDEYLLAMRKDCDIYAVNYEVKKTFQEKLGAAAATASDHVGKKLLSQLYKRNNF